jgi:hypothetical protein
MKKKNRIGKGGKKAKKIVRSLEMELRRELNKLFAAEK